MSSQSAMVVTATVLSYNSLESLKEALQALRLQTTPPGRVIVVDNASHDGTPDYLTCMDWIEILALDENVGVGAGHNRAIEKAFLDPSCEYVWVLEHDSVPTPSCLEEMLRVMNSLQRDSRPIGIVLPILARQGEASVETVRSPVLRGARMTFNGPLFPKQTVETVGLLREDFFLGQEDFEYADRLAAAGLGIYFATSALLFHENKGMRRRGIVPSVTRSYYSIRNSVFLDVHIRQRPRSRIAVIARCLAGAAKSFIREDHKLARICARLVATLDALTGRLGERDYWFLSTPSGGDANSIADR